MSAPEFQLKKPLTIQLGTGVSGVRNGVDFSTREFFLSKIDTWYLGFFLKRLAMYNPDIPAPIIPIFFIHYLKLL